MAVSIFSQFWIRLNLGQWKMTFGKPICESLSVSISVRKKKKQKKQTNNSSWFKDYDHFLNFLGIP